MRLFYDSSKDDEFAFRHLNFKTRCLLTVLSVDLELGWYWIGSRHVKDVDIDSLE